MSHGKWLFRMTFNRTDQDVRILCLLSGLSFSGSSIHPQNTGCRFLVPCLPRASHFFTCIPNLFALSLGLGILLPDFVRLLLLELFIVWLPFRLDPDFPVGHLCCRRPHHARSCLGIKGRCHYRLPFVNSSQWLRAGEGNQPKLKECTLLYLSTKVTCGMVQNRWLIK